MESVPVLCVLNENKIANFYVVHPFSLSTHNPQIPTVVFLALVSGQTLVFDILNHVSCYP
jgi:hypothetical protein